MDFEIARENLSLVKSVLDKHQIKFWLAWGTCLGAIRDKNFIIHDKDIDIEVSSKDGEKVIALIPELEALGFTHATWWVYKGVKIIRQQEDIDIFFAEPVIKDDAKTGWITGDEYLEQDFFSELEEIDFLGEIYKVPKNPEAYLNYVYGATWQQPIDFYSLASAFKSEAINSELRRQNLQLLKEVLHSGGIDFWLGATSCIDALLSKEGKENYSRITLGTYHQNKSKILAILPYFQKQGFSPLQTSYLQRYSTTFMRYNDAIEIEYLYPEPKDQEIKTRWICNYSDLFYQDFFSKLETIDYLGDTYYIPRNTEEYLIQMYGEPFWRLPNFPELGFSAKHDLLVQHLQQHEIVKIPVNFKWFFRHDKNYFLIGYGTVIAIKKIEQSIQNGMMVLARYQHETGFSEIAIKVIKEINLNGQVRLRSDFQGEKDIWLSSENIIGHVIANYTK